MASSFSGASSVFDTLKPRSSLGSAMSNNLDDGVVASLGTTTTTANTIASAVPEKAPDDSSKLKTFLGILRQFIGVSDIATVRFSLPAQLLEPTPNLEYWNYLDRPETFVSIGKSDDHLGRMLEVLRFWFTKDLCNWEIEDTENPIATTAHTSAASTTSAAISGGSERVKISYLTEQTSHHPPVSAFYVDCPQRGITARGFDQISAKFTGTSIRVTPGQHNLGIFITLRDRGNEEYQLTHPAAHLGGLLRGSLSITVSDTCFITCAETRIKAILQYLDEGWIGKAQNRVVGIIFRYDPENDNQFKIKDVPESDVLARIEGCWHEKIYYTLTPTESNICNARKGKDTDGGKEKDKDREKHLLIDIAPLFPVSKLIPPDDQQLPNESRKFWSRVTAAIGEKQYSLATKLKQELEEKQRQLASARKERNEEWKPRFFTVPVASSGKPELTADGERLLKGLHEGNFMLEWIGPTGNADTAGSI
ncbi:oxysterol-binding protein [Blastomyces dermatitidis ER-3]|uniref:Oxysterol-binding protein n=1 Tax=Ajellomyces dermatitidis (strain ER-3 / ATCC MYA-2586) TaxID=559297 RepID=A0ABP2F0P6_AJEDR|nr:oxysterol-binding protein [Blastomyces dermatitidis ER-3]EEQ90239.2 oxysterol-binding protein [Blastomyces dermatitidis ER-3]